MNNEPYGWVKNGEYVLYIEKPDSVFNYIPLYTHPVKELKNIVLASATCSCGKVMEVTNLQPVKELTDEEIEDEWFKVFKPETGIGKNLTNGVYEFAMAILRKAQEK